MKLNSSGNLVWLKQLGAVTSVPGGDTSQSDRCSSVTVDGSGSVYCAGYTSGSLGEANGGNGHNDAFVLKLNSSGNLVWLKQLGSVTSVPGGNTSSDDQCNSVTVDGSGNVYCAGNTFGSLGETNGGGGNADAFVMKLDSSGNLAWLKQLGSVTPVPGGNTAEQDQCSSIAVDGSGNVYCAGATNGSLGEAAGGDEDAFVMKLNASGNLVGLKQLGSVTSVPGGDTLQSDVCTSVVVDGSGQVYCAGSTNGSLGEANGGDRDAFIWKVKGL